MKFFEKLNEYMEGMNCTAKELSNASGLSPATSAAIKTASVSLKLTAKHSVSFARVWLTFQRAAWGQNCRKAR